MTLSKRNLQLARRAKKAGAKHSLRIVIEARAAGLGDHLSLAFAVLEQETGFDNIFGHDEGALFSNFKRIPVTNEKVSQLLRSVDRGEPSNGVGLPQLTYPPFIRRAAAMPGGASSVRNQLRVAFSDLAHLVHDHGERDALAIYNAGQADSPKGRRYASTVLDRKERFHRALVRKG